MNSEDKLFFKGIYGDDSINMVRETIHIGSFEATGKRHEWYIKPHVHSNLFQIFVIEEGYAELLINDESELIEGISFLTIPKNIVHGFKMHPDVKGWVISLHDKSMENMLKLDADIIIRMDEVHIFKYDAEDKLISDAYNTLHKCIYEYHSDLPAKQHALQYLVGMLLLRLYRIPTTSKLSIQIQDNKFTLFYRRFLQLIREKNSFKFGVEEYASLLDISAGYLNKICREVSGQSPKDIIIEYYIDEIKKMLADFELSISDVAYKIELNDPGYLTRLFKKKTGMTPKEYRASIGAK